MGAPQKPYANITKSFVHLAAQICFMKNCWNPLSMSAATGACTRHYHPTLSIWLSVDPMSDKYPSTKGCTYIGDNDALIKHFGFPTSGSKSTKQLAQVYINSNMESNNPYEPKGFALGWVCAKAESSINNSHRYKYASLTIPANKLSANCISKIEISGPWFNDGGPLYLPFTFTIVPRYLKHKY